MGLLSTEKHMFLLFHSPLKKKTILGHLVLKMNFPASRVQITDTARFGLY